MIKKHFNNKLLYFIVALLIFYPFVTSTLNDDFGMDLIGAKLVSQGEVPFVDFYTPNGIIPLLFLGSLIKITGQWSIALVLASYTIFIFSWVVMHTILKNTFPSNYSFYYSSLVAFLMIVPFGGYYHDYLAVLFCLSIIALLAMPLKSKNNFYFYFGIAFFILLAVLSKKTVVHWLLIFFTLLIFLKLIKVKELFNILLLVLVAIFCLIVFMYEHHFVHNFIEYNILLPLEFSKTHKPDLIYLPLYLIFPLNLSKINILFNLFYLVSLAILLRELIKNHNNIKRTCIVVYIGLISFVPVYFGLWGRGGFEKYWLLFFIYIFAFYTVKPKLLENKIFLIIFVTMVTLISLKSNPIHMSNANCLNHTNIKLHRLSKYESLRPFSPRWNWINYEEVCEAVKFIEKSGYEKISFFDDNAYLVALAVMDNVNILTKFHFFQLGLSIPNDINKVMNIISADIDTNKEHDNLAYIITLPIENKFVNSKYSNRVFRSYDIKKSEYMNELEKILSNSLKVVYKSENIKIAIPRHVKDTK